MSLMPLIRVIFSFESSLVSHRRHNTTVYIDCTESCTVYVHGRIMSSVIFMCNIGGDKRLFNPRLSLYMFLGSYTLFSVKFKDCKFNVMVWNRDQGWFINVWLFESLFFVLDFPIWSINLKMQYVVSLSLKIPPTALSDWLCVTSPNLSRLNNLTEQMIK